MLIDSIKEIQRLKDEKEQSNAEVINQLNSIPEGVSHAESINETEVNYIEMLKPVTLLDNMDDDNDEIPQVEEEKNEDPMKILFGKELKEYKVNINIY